MMTKDNLVINALSPAHLVKSWAKQEAEKEFNSEAKVTVAAACAKLAHEYLRSLPVGYNVNDKEKLRKQTAKYIQDNIREELSDYPWYTKLGVAILAILFWQVTLVILVGWAIIKVFKIHFGD